MCPTGKKPYPNGASAHREARVLARKCKSHPLHPYRCPSCSQWHLANSQRKGNQRHQKRRQLRRG